LCLGGLAVVEQGALPCRRPRTNRRHRCLYRTPFLPQVRKNGTCPWLRPDGKTQVTVEYKKDGGAVVPVRVHTILISTQHNPGERAAREGAGGCSMTQTPLAAAARTSLPLPLPRLLFPIRPHDLTQSDPHPTPTPQT
jgi:hypothetical protein